MNVFYSNNKKRKWPSARKNMIKLSEKTYFEIGYNLSTWKQIFARYKLAPHSEIFVLPTYLHLFLNTLISYLFVLLLCFVYFCVLVSWLEITTQYNNVKHIVLYEILNPPSISYELLILWLTGSSIETTYSIIFRMYLMCFATVSLIVDILLLPI